MVYGVFSGEYSDWFVVGYFEDKEDAEAYCKEHNDKCEYDWDEYYIKPLLNLANNDPAVFRKYVYNEYRDEIWEENGEYSEAKLEAKVRSLRGEHPVKWVDVWMQPCDYNEERVRKIAHDAIAKYNAAQKGLL